jgi:hypothetical protein
MKQRNALLIGNCNHGNTSFGAIAVSYRILDGCKSPASPKVNAYHPAIREQISRPFGKFVRSTIINSNLLPMRSSKIGVSPRPIWTINLFECKLTVSFP